MQHCCEINRCSFRSVNIRVTALWVPRKIGSSLEDLPPPSEGCVSLDTAFRPFCSETSAKFLLLPDEMFLNHYNERDSLGRKDGFEELKEISERRDHVNNNEPQREMGNSILAVEHSFQATKNTLENIVIEVGKAEDSEGNHSVGIFIFPIHRQFELLQR